MYESGALSLETVAIANKPHALEIIQNLISSGSDPLVPNSRKLFPYHFAQSLEIYDALTPPPIERKCYLLTLARSTAKEDEKIEILRNAVNIIPFNMVLSGEDNLTCIGIAAQKREYRFAQELGLRVEKQFGDFMVHSNNHAHQALLKLQRIIEEKDSHIKELQERLKKEETPQDDFGLERVICKLLEMEDKCARLAAENDKLKIEHKEEIEKYKIEVDHLKKEAAGNVALENGEIQRKLEIAVERIGNLTFENDLLKKDSSNKEELLKAEILNLNKCISRKNEKCADLSAKNERLKKESDRISNAASEIKKENEKLKRDAGLLKAQFDCINKLENDKEELQEQLKGVQTIKMQAQEHIRQLSELFDVKNNSHSEMRVKELEDQIVALKTVNSDLESISKKFEQVTSCSLCDEKYESTGERAPVKLKCSHIFCSKCSYNWLKSQGNKSSCPSCRTPYRSEDIRFVNLNADL